MHFETTYHSLLLSQKVDGLDVLNTSALLSCLEGSDKGKKRAAPSTTVQGRRKRARVSLAGDDAHGIEDEETFEEKKSVPVYRHVLELYYETTTESPEHDLADDGASALGSQEGDSKHRLLRKAESLTQGGQYDIDVATVALRTSGPQRQNSKATLQACITEPESAYLLTIPQVANDFDLAAHDMRFPHLVNPLMACHVLCTAGRAEMSARLSLHLQRDPPEQESAVLPFHLRLEIDVSLVCPAIFEPIEQSARSDVEEAQRRVLWHLFPSRVPPPEAFRGALDIPLLFSILGPAPRLGSPVQEELAQPEGLLPTLLPFQRRSVAWMLSREGRALSESGDVVATGVTGSAPDEHTLFWDEVQVGEGERWYVNRLRGIISPVKPEEDTDALGGILAEEPGLGKTLECIALILLNPAVSRGPSVKRWDKEVKVFVKEIKTTLIVTPVSLAPQWVDELKLHAPNLKVLIYDGWQKVPVPITEADVAKERASRLQQKGRRKAKPDTKTAATTLKAQPEHGREPITSTRRGKRKAAVDADINGQDRQQGDGAEAEEDDGIMDWCTYVNTFDVCITTYNVLQHDLGVARAPPTRPRRMNVQYSNIDRARSPLVMCEWYRVIMDEVQMVGGGKTEEMVSLIPRLSSFAVSGTPARAQVADLIHVLNFLRVNAVSNNPRLWARIQQPAYVNEFVSLFHRYAIRTVKTAVKDELTIPPQTRYLVPIELGRVERHVYDQNFENALLELGLDARGVAVREDWEVDTAVLRFWLRKLRGICTHPQVGQLLNRADKLHKPGVLKTIGEVLEGMRDQNWRNLMEDSREKVKLLATIAQLQQRDESVPDRNKLALKTLLEAEKEARRLVEDINTALEEHAKKGEILKANAEKLSASRGQAPSEGKGKGKGRATSEESSLTDMNDSDNEDIPRNPAGEEHLIKRTALHSRLRECRITLHRVLFLEGDVYHVLGQSSNAEELAYAGAEQLRRLLLKGTEEAAARAMTTLSRNASVKALKEADLYISVPYCDKGGIRSADLMEEANDIIKGLLNEQSALLWRWREKLIALLTQSLTSNDEDADGQEYSRSLETQGEAEAYLEAYATLMADRREALTAERTLLAAHDVREKHIRHTKAAQKAASGTLRALLEDEDDGFVPLERLGSEDLLPEHDVLRQTLRDERKAVSEEFDPSRAIKSVMIDLQNIVARIHREDDTEKILVREAVKRLRSLLNDQGKLMDRMHSDFMHLRKAFNERISYFRQLQEISDSVAEVTWEGDLGNSIANARREQAELDAKINTSRARQRYLDHLATSQEEGTADEEDNTCVLCRCEFTRGYITPCAHVFCEACLKAWLSRREGKACPVCRVAINTDQLQRFSLSKATGPVQSAPVKIMNNEPAPRSHRQIHYNVIEPGIFEDINAMESFGSYGSKIQTLIRHLLYLQINDPGSKSIIFSAWADSLLIIQHALNSNGISCLRIDQRTGKENAAKKFRTDPTISVLLLHGERENAGLNVTCASRVFLVESVVNHAFELQAIARIDRMGQTRPTEVFCYYAEDTVERNILDLAARQGQSLYTKDNSAGTLNVTPFAMPAGKNTVDSPTKKMQKGDYVFKTDDMLAIFFPHLFEDVEYLLQPEELVANEQGQSTGAPRSTNAVAGPSRLSG